MAASYPRTRLVRLAWEASHDGPFSEVALIERTASLADEKYRPKLLQSLPAVWLRLDEAGTIDEWLAASGLDGDAIDAINAAIGAGLPRPTKKANLKEYALRPGDFPALLFLAFIAARLATPYMGGGPHRKVREQFWYAPELAIILIRCLPAKLDLLTVEHVLRKIFQAPVGGPCMDDYLLGLPIPPGSLRDEPRLNDDVMGLIELPENDDEKA